MNINEAKAIRTAEQQEAIDHAYTRFETFEPLVLTIIDVSSRAREIAFYFDAGDNAVVFTYFDADGQNCHGVGRFSDFDQFEIFLQHQLDTDCIVNKLESGMLDAKQVEFLRSITF